MGYIKTAVGMFNAGEVLREYFGHFDVGTEDEKARKRSTIIPMVVTYMFGIEVGLKALIEGQGQKPPHTHDLKNLYGNLAAIVRKRIADKLVANTGESRIALEGLLSHHRNSLQEWRYMGDFQGAKVVHPSLTGATLRAIIEVHTGLYGVETDVTDGASTVTADVPLSIQNATSEYMKGRVHKSIVTPTKADVGSATIGWRAAHRWRKRLLSTMAKQLAQGYFLCFWNRRY